MYVSGVSVTDVVLIITSILTTCYIKSSKGYAIQSGSRIKHVKSMTCFYE